MRWILITVILACITPSFARDIVKGICGECGYETGELFAGYGRIPGYIADVYRDPETGTFHLVGFDIILVTADEIAVTANNSYIENGEMSVDEIAVTINNNHRETGTVSAEPIAVTINNNHRTVENIYEAWESPQVIGALVGNGSIPEGVLPGNGATGDPAAWTLVSLDDTSPCPVCGGNTIHFERIGNWD